ncbi:MAG: 3-oxoacyl-[acyl-carrier-protein] synthase III C-terminal domain-containing protein [Bacteroidota bacterium]
MSLIAAVAKIDLPYKIAQQELKKHAADMFSADFPQVQRLISAFDNTEIVSRNFCQPLDYYVIHRDFEEHNKEYIHCALKYSIQAIEACIKSAKIHKEDITDIIFVSTTGLATPSLDALIINEMRLSPYINRTPVWGLGCAGGVGGVAKANLMAKANPDAIVLLVAVELCTLTFLKNDYSKSNFIASSLFSDGIAACIVKGDNHTGNDIKILGSSSKLYYNSLDVMGWEFLDTGFKVLFSKDIPTFINKYIKADILNFLSKYHIDLSDIKNFIFHPGGKKVLGAYSDALGIQTDFLKNTRETMNAYGNMSSSTVLYVLERFFTRGFENGYGLMLAMGPGFSSEMVLLSMNKQ